MRLITDSFAYCADNLPSWNTISISGYHIREAGATATQEIAFTFSNAIAYCDAAINAGLEFDAFAPNLSFFFNCHNDFFEEIAKFRAARRIWARIMKERYGAKSPKSCMLKTHAQTAGVSLTAQQPINNVIRVSLQALAAVLGGTQSLHTNSMDETLALPTEEAVTVALRTQQIIAEESGVVNNIDPLGGSYFVEQLTNRVETQAMDYINKIDEMGGIVRAIDRGYPQMEIADAAYRYQQELDRGEKFVVGVNKYEMAEESTISTLRVSEKVETDQRNRLKAVKNKRNSEAVSRSLNNIAADARDGKNLIPSIKEAVERYATVGEISDVFREVYGEYTDPGYF